MVKFNSLPKRSICAHEEYLKRSLRARYNSLKFIIKNVCISFDATGQEKNFEIQLPSGPVHFSFQLPPLKYYLPNRRCEMFMFFVSTLNLPRALLLVPDFYFLHIIQYGGQYGDRRTKRKQSLLGF